MSMSVRKSCIVHILLILLVFVLPVSGQYVFYEDFTGDLSKWAYSGVSVSGGIAEIQATGTPWGNYLISNQVFDRTDTEYILEIELALYAPYDGRNETFHGWGSSSAGVGQPRAAYYYGYDMSWTTYVYDGGSTVFGFSTWPSGNTFYTYTYQINATSGGVLSSTVSPNVNYLASNDNNFRIKINPYNGGAKVRKVTVRTASNTTSFMSLSMSPDTSYEIKDVGRNHEFYAVYGVSASDWVEGKTALRVTRNGQVVTGMGLINDSGSLPMSYNNYGTYIFELYNTDTEYIIASSSIYVSSSIDFVNFHPEVSETNLSSIKLFYNRQNCITDCDYSGNPWIIIYMYGWNNDTNNWNTSVDGSVWDVSPSLSGSIDLQPYISFDRAKIKAYIVDSVWWEYDGRYKYSDQIIYNQTGSEIPIPTPTPDPNQTPKPDQTPIPVYTPPSTISQPVPTDVGGIIGDGGSSLGENTTVLNESIRRRGNYSAGEISNITNITSNISGQLALYNYTESKSIINMFIPSILGAFPPELLGLGLLTWILTAIIILMNRSKK